MAIRQRYIVATICAVIGLVAAIGAPVKFESLSFLGPTATEYQLQPHANSDGSASVVLEGLRPGEVPLFNQHTMVNLYQADRSIATAVDFGGLEALGIDNPMFRGETWTPNNSGGQEFKVLITTKTPDTVAALIDYRSLYVPAKPIKIVALKQSSLSDFAPLITDFLPFMTAQNCFSVLQRGDFLTTRCPEFGYQAPYKLDYNPKSRALTITPTHHQMWDTLKVYEQGVIFTYGKDPFGKYSPGASLPKTRLAANLPRAVNNVGGFVMQAGPNGNGGDQEAEEDGINSQDAAPNGDVEEDSNGSHQEPPRFITEDCDSDKGELFPHGGVEINGLRHEGKRVLLGPDLPDPTGKGLEDYTNRCNSLIAQNVSAPIWDPNKACPGLVGCPTGCSGGCELAGFFFKFGNVLEGWERISPERYGGQVWCHVPSVPEQPNELRIEVTCSPCEARVSSSSGDSATSSSSANETSEEPTTSTSSEPVSPGTSESSTSQASSVNQAEPINRASSSSSAAPKAAPSSEVSTSVSSEASTNSPSPSSSADSVPPKPYFLHRTCVAYEGLSEAHDDCRSVRSDKPKPSTCSSDEECTSTAIPTISPTIVPTLRPEEHRSTKFQYAACSWLDGEAQCLPSFTDDPKLENECSTDFDCVRHYDSPSGGQTSSSSSSEPVSFNSSESSTSQASSANQAEPINASSPKSSDAETRLSSTTSSSTSANQGAPILGGSATSSDTQTSAQSSTSSSSRTSFSSFSSSTVENSDSSEGYQSTSASACCTACVKHKINVLPDAGSLSGLVDAFTTSDQETNLQDSRAVLEACCSQSVDKARYDSGHDLQIQCKRLPDIIATTECTIKEAGLCCTSSQPTTPTIPEECKDNLFIGLSGHGSSSFFKEICMPLLISICSQNSTSMNFDSTYTCSLARDLKEAKRLIDEARSRGCKIKGRLNTDSVMADVKKNCSLISESPQLVFDTSDCETEVECPSNSRCVNSGSGCITCKDTASGERKRIKCIPFEENPLLGVWGSC
jgi:hypothetical protein